MEYLKKVRAILGNRKLSNSQQLSEIKLQVNTSEYKEALKFHPIFNKILLKNPFFYTINEIYLKEVYIFSGNFKREFKWLTNILENYLEEINAFIIYKNKFEHHFILCEFEQAESVIKEVEKLFGISLWSIEANLMIEEYHKGTESNWNRLSVYLKEINNPIYEFIISSSSKRIESRLSYDSFVNQFQNDIDNINAESLIIDFFVFKNFTIANYDYTLKNLEGVLYLLNTFSILDQYLILIDVISYNISNSRDSDKLFAPFINKAKEIVSSDNRLINIYNIINEQNAIRKFETTDRVLYCLNSYYSGDFDKSLALSKLGIKDNPLEYEYYEVYCKSIINLNADFEPLNISLFVDNLLEDTYRLLTFTKGEEENNRRLFKTAICLMNFNIGKQIYSLLAEIEDNRGRPFINGTISSTFNSHKNIYLSENRITVSNNFKELADQHAFKVCNYKIGLNIQFNGNISHSLSQNITFNAIAQFKKQNYTNVIEILSNADDLNQLPYYFERKISLLYNSYLKLGMIKEPLVLFGDVFFDSSLINRKINYGDLYEIARKTNNNDDFKKLIEWPILYSLISKEYDLFEVYDDFMCLYDIYKIQELNIESFISLFSLKRVIYFLQNVAVIDTLKYSTDYNSISEVEEDRILVLNILLKIDNINKLLYEKEINEIYRINSVRKVLKEVDEGRLYIDVNSLKEIQTKKFIDDFKRFKEIEYSASGQTLIGFNPLNTKNWEKILTEKRDAIERNYNSADYLAFKSIYLESRDNFLFSKEYGLDSCLSTRIRHGALKNHIRSVFEKLDLVTSKSNDKYKDNEVWQRQLYPFYELNAQVQTRLKIFSREIDDYTLYIVEKLIQIRTEKNNDKKEGLFQFYTYDDLLYDFYSEQRIYFNSIDVAIDTILTSFVNYTLIYVDTPE